MAGSSTQMSDLIGIVHSKTVQGEIAWSRSAERGKFQARVGDFIIQISAGTFGLLSDPAGIPGSAIQITVSKIDGQVVDTAGGNSFSASTNVSVQDQGKLRDIYMRLSTTNQDLETLIKLLK